MGGHVSGVPNLIDENIGDIAAVVGFVERKPVNMFFQKKLKKK
jgi:hypothetical protein